MGPREPDLCRCNHRSPPCLPLSRRTWSECAAWRAQTSPEHGNSSTGQRFCKCSANLCSLRAKQNSERSPCGSPDATRGEGDDRRDDAVHLTPTHGRSVDTYPTPHTVAHPHTCTHATGHIGCRTHTQATQQSCLTTLHVRMHATTIHTHAVAATSVLCGFSREPVGAIAHGQACKYDNEEQDTVWTQAESGCQVLESRQIWQRANAGLRL